MSPFWLDFLRSIWGWSIVFLFYLLVFELEPTALIVIELFIVDAWLCFFEVYVFLLKTIDATESLELRRYFLLWVISTLENFRSCFECFSLSKELLSCEIILIPEFLLFPLSLSTFSLLLRKDSYGDSWGRWVKMKETYWSDFLELYRAGLEDLDYFFDRNIWLNWFCLIAGCIEL